MKRFKKVVSTVLCLILVMSTVSVAQAAKKVQAIKLDTNKLTLTSEESDYLYYYLEVKFTPSNSKSKLTWKSSNPAIAKVDQKGKVTAVSTGNKTVTVTNDKGHKYTCNVGKATIMVTTANGKKAVCKVTVYKTFDDSIIVGSPYMMDELLKDKNADTNKNKDTDTNTDETEE